MEAIIQKLSSGYYDNKLNRKANPQAYMVENIRLGRVFKADAIEYAGLTGNTRADAAYDIAYNERHGSGRREIVEFLAELADLLR